jgi:hypothetical protein
MLLEKQNIQNKKNEKIKTSGTAHNRIVYASPPVGGEASTTARSLRLAPLHGLLHPHFAALVFATQALIWAAKTSQTAGTLCDISAEIFWKVLTKE